MPDSFTLDELLSNGLLDERDELIQVRIEGDSKWVIAQDYPYHTTETPFFIDEFGQVRRNEISTEKSSEEKHTINNNQIEENFAENPSSSNSGNWGCAWILIITLGLALIV